MKKPSLKISLRRVLWGVLISLGIIAVLAWYVSNPHFPGLWESVESLCLDEVISKPFEGRGQMIESFKGCLIRNGVRFDDAIRMLPPNADINITG